jgi:DNA-directed RNA polymerase subunit M/transcription elongation factor TFIIS
MPAVPNSAFSDFLNANHAGHFIVPFTGIGIRTLADLCNHTAAQVAVVTGDPLTAFRLITAAHDHMKRTGLHIDWLERVSRLYQAYNPGKANQVASLLKAYVGEEENLWRSIREKYEPELSARSMLTSDAASASPVRGRLPVGSSSDYQPTLPAEAPLAPSGGLVRSATTSQGEVVYCPACRHGFVHTSSAITATHAAEASEAKKHELQERQQTAVVTSELSEAVQRLTERLSDAQQIAQHYEGVCKEQEQWIRMLEQRVADMNQAMAESMMSGSPNSTRRLPGGPSEALEGSGVHNSYSAAPPGPSDSAKRAAPLLTGPERAKLRRRLVDFYLKYSPDKVEMVDVVLQQWAGREDELERLMAVEPSVVRVNAR